MDPTRYRCCKELLIGALDQPEESRRSWLIGRCGEDAELLAEVEELLRYETDDSSLDGIPEHIGSYRILRLIGEGGMGRVFEAEQESPKRRVALKVLLSSWATGQMRRRFELEAELLGRLEHPGIARIYEAGVTPPPESTPYLSMELVDGRELGDWRDAELPELRRRVDVLIRLVEAVGQAHRQGIIHRDLKPSNVLVDVADQPKVLDFGIARALDTHEGQTLLTRSGQVMGTLAYMAPEQVAGEPASTLSDVYSLGVIAYELLGGELPHDLTATNLAEASRIVQRGIRRPLRELGKEFRGDLETIVHKALEVDAHRRFPSAQALADDLRRYLDRQPIQARPASTVYQLGRFVVRNRLLVGASALVLAAIVVGAGLAIWQASKERKARLEADQARIAADDARIAAEDARAVAERAREEAISEREGRGLINSFLAEILQSSSPFDLGGDAPLRDLLVKAKNSVPIRFADRPKLASDVHTMLATAFRSIDELELAAEQSGRALALVEQRDLPESREWQQARGSLLILHCESLNALGAREESMELGAQAIRALDTAGTLSVRIGARRELAMMCNKAGELNEARRWIDEAIKLAVGFDELEASERAGLWSCLGAIHIATGDFSAGYDSFTTALEIMPTESVEQRYRRAAMLSSLIYCGSRTKRQELSDEYLEEHMQLWRGMIDGDHSKIAIGLSNHATLLRMLGRHEEAVVPYQEALAMSERLFESPNRTVAINRGNLGALLMYLGRTEEAQPLIETALEEQSILFGPRSSGVALNHGHLGDCYANRGELARARDQHRLSHEKLIDSLGPGNHETVHQAIKTASFEARTGQVDAARRRVAEAMPLLRQLPATSQETSLRRLEITVRESSESAPDFALSICRQAMPVVAALEDDPQRSGLLLADLGSRLRDLGALEESRQWLDRALAMVDGSARDEIAAERDAVLREIEARK